MYVPTLLPFFGSLQNAVGSSFRRIMQLAVVQDAVSQAAISHVIVSLQLFLYSTLIYTRRPIKCILARWNLARGYKPLRTSHPRFW